MLHSEIEGKCIIHYHGKEKHGDLVFLTFKTSKAILSAKAEHELRNDSHLVQCQSIPNKKSIQIQISL